MSILFHPIVAYCLNMTIVGAVLLSVLWNVDAVQWTGIVVVCLCMYFAGKIHGRDDFSREQKNGQT